MYTQRHTPGEADVEQYAALRFDGVQLGPHFPQTDLICAGILGIGESHAGEIHRRDALSEIASPEMFCLEPEAVENALMPPDVYHAISWRKKNQKR